MLPSSRSRQSDADRRAPIRWSSDSITVGKVLVYCQEAYHGTKKKDRYSDARRDILSRIYSNLQNPMHLAYNGRKPYGEVEYATVAREADKHPSGKAGYLTALDSEWEIIQTYFARNFIKPDADN